MGKDRCAHRSNLRDRRCRGQPGRRPRELDPNEYQALLRADPRNVRTSSSGVGSSDRACHPVAILLTLANWRSNRICKPLFGTTGCLMHSPLRKSFAPPLIRSIRLESRGFSFDVEVATARLARYRISGSSEVPIPNNPPFDPKGKKVVGITRSTWFWTLIRCRLC